MAELTLPEQNKKWATPFFTIWSGQAVSLLGSQLVQFALIWWLTQTTGKATVLATASLMGLLPQVIIGPVAGTLVDRWSRRITMIVADSSIAVATVFLAVLFATGQVQIWHVYVLMFFRSAAGGFHWSAMQASTSLMVPKVHLSRVQGLNQILNGGMNIASAPLGALLLDVLPLQGILLIDVTTAMVAVLPLFFIPIPQPPQTELQDGIPEKPSFWQDFRLGLRYLFSWPGLVMISIMATLINFVLNPAMSLIPILVTGHFGGQALQLAALESVFGVGVILGGGLLSIWGGFRRRILTSLLGLGLIGLGSLLLGFAPAWAFPVAITGMLVMGIAMPITNGSIFAVLQAIVAPEMQGRVFALIGSFATLMTPLGLIIAGPIADRFGVQSWIIAGGVVSLLMGVVGYLTPAVVYLEERRQAQTSSQVALAVQSNTFEVK